MNENNIHSVSPSKEDLDKLVRQHMIAAFGAGLVPIPFIDLAAMTGVQINLVRKIAARFGVPFSHNAVKSIVGALVGGAVPAYSAPPLSSLVKAIPVAGGLIGMVTMPAVSSAMTYAVGYVFIQHFESGGTLLTFDAGKAKALFGSLFQKGKAETEAMSQESGDEPSSPDDESDVTAEKKPKDRKKD